MPFVARGRSKAWSTRAFGIVLAGAFIVAAIAFGFRVNQDGKPATELATVSVSVFHATQTAVAKDLTATVLIKK